MKKKFSVRLDEFQDQATALNKNLSTVAIVAASDDVPLDAFTCELVHSLIAIGKKNRSIVKENISLVVVFFFRSNVTFDTTVDY